MPHRGQSWPSLILVLALAGLVGCAPRPRPAPPQYSSDPKLIPKLDPILALPHYPQPSPNGYEVFETLTKRVNKTHELKGDFSGGHYHGPTHQQELAAAPAQLADNAAVLAELRQALQMEWLYPHPAQTDLSSPVASQARYLGRLLTWEAALMAQAAETDAAVADLVDALTLAVKLPRGAGTMEWAAGRALEGVALPELARLVAGHRLTPRGLADLAQQLAAVERQRVPLREIIAFDYECQGPQALNLSPVQFADLMSQARRPVWLTVALHLPGAKPVVRSFISQRLPDLMQWDAKIARLATQPYYAIRSQIPAKGGDYSMLVLCPFPRGGIWRRAQAQARGRGMQIMIALELARSKQGAYPPSLKPLGLPAAELRDPFSGQPLIYKPQGDSYTLYSVGPNGQNNGGKATTKAEEPDTDFVIWPARLRS